MNNTQITNLVIKAQKGDSNALNELFNETYNDIYYFALKTVKESELACDITQDTFVAIINNLSSLKEPAAFMGWAKTVAYSQCTRYFSKKKEVLVEENEEGATLFDTVREEHTEFIPDEALDQSEFKKAILGILDTLSPEQRSATMMYYFDEMSVREISETQNVSEGTVKSRLNYARKTIKAGVEDYEKKNNVKLHAIPFFPFFDWLFKGEFEGGMPIPAAKRVAKNIASASGKAISLTKGAVAGTTVASSGASGGAFLASIPLGAKIAAGVVALALLVGGAVAVIDRSDKESGEESGTYSAESAEISETVSSDDVFAEISEEVSQTVSEEESFVDESTDESTDESQPEDESELEKQAIMKHAEEIASVLFKMSPFEYICYEKPNEDKLKQAVFYFTEPADETEYTGEYLFKVSELEANALKYFGKEMGYKSLETYDSENDTVIGSVYSSYNYTVKATDCFDLGDGKFEVKISVYDKNKKLLDTATVNLKESENGFALVNIVNDNHHNYNSSKLLSYPTAKKDGERLVSCTACGKKTNEPYTAEAFARAFSLHLAESWGLPYSIYGGEIRSPYINSPDQIDGERFTRIVIDYVEYYKAEEIPDSPDEYRYYDINAVDTLYSMLLGKDYDWTKHPMYDAESDSLAELYLGGWGYGPRWYWQYVDCVKNDDGTVTATVAMPNGPDVELYSDLYWLESFVAVTFKLTENGIELVSYLPAHDFTSWEIADGAVPNLNNEVTLTRTCETYGCGFTQTRPAYFEEKYSYYAAMFLKFWAVDPKTASVDEIISSLRMFAVDPEEEFDDGYTEIFSLESLDKASLERYGKTYDWTTSSYYDSESNKIIYLVSGMGDGPRGIIKGYGHTENSDGSITFKILSYHIEYVNGIKFIKTDNEIGEITILPKEYTTILVEIKYY